MRPKKILAEVSLASLVTGVWVAGCYLAAEAAESFRTPWWETEAWGAWWVGLLAGAAFLFAGTLAVFSERLGGDRPVRILLRTALVTAAVALGLAVQAARGPRLTPGDFLLASPQPSLGGAPQAVAVAVAVALLSVLLMARREPRRRNGASEA